MKVYKNRKEVEKYSKPTFFPIFAIFTLPYNFFEKNGFHEKLFQKSAFFMKIGIFHKNWRFLRKSAFLAKNT
jgi:hypothetical protein